MRDPNGAEDAISLRRHVECSKILQTGIGVLTLYAMFCVITLSAPARELLGSDAVVNMPLVNIPTSLGRFLTWGPLGVALLTGYVHYYYWLLRRISIAEEERFPAAFNLSDPVSRSLTFVMLYALPLSLASFVLFQSLHRPAWIISALCLGITGTICLQSLLRAASVKYLTVSRLHYPLLLIAVLIPILPVIVFPTITLEHLQRLHPLDLKNLYVDCVEGQRSRCRDLSRHNLNHADLKNAVLLSVDLSGSAFVEADLTNAQLIDSNLTGATVRGAVLARSVLTGATGVDFSTSTAVLCETVLPDGTMSRRDCDRVSAQSAP